MLMQNLKIKIQNYRILLLASLFITLVLPTLINAAERIDADPTSPIAPGTIQVGVPGVTSPGGRAFGSIPGSGRTQTITLPNPLKATNFAELINRLTNWLLVIGAPILVLMIIIGAFQIMTGAGNPENITKGRHTITYAIIGYALLLISSGITLIIKQLLGVQ